MPISHWPAVAKVWLQVGYAETDADIIGKCVDLNDSRSCVCSEVVALDNMNLCSILSETREQGQVKTCYLCDRFKLLDF
jgi:hypothetical protein